MPQLTKRQWQMLQQGLLCLDTHREEFWDTDDDGPMPSSEEIAALAHVVGDMPHDKDDEPADDTPMRNGKPYVTDNERVISALLLTDAGHDAARPIDPPDFKIVEAAVAGWTDDQKAAAFEWAALEHLAAGDNDVERVECPPHVEAIRPQYGRKK